MISIELSLEIEKKKKQYLKKNHFLTHTGSIMGKSSRDKRVFSHINDIIHQF